ncbi:MAG: hotdog fold thioesterase [Saprospiraceae bacterium]|nr:hotdog fold thioesterase [Saprospiraceae bacterium]
MIWKIEPHLDALNASGRNTLVEQLDIKFVEVGDNYLKAKMPVDHRTVQPMGLLHGGASVALAETMGSVASTLMIEEFGKYVPVGVEINANHLSSARSGYVIGTVWPIKIGRRMHVWRIIIEDESGKQICESRLTTMVIKNK